MPSTRKSKQKVGDQEVTMDRRRKDRRSSDRSATAAPATERRGGERRAKVQRRRQIDPTTCERDYSLDEIEFMQALDAYKRAAGRMFPTCSEILEVIRGLGYVKLSDVEGGASEEDGVETAEQGSGTPEVESAAAAGTAAAKG